MYKKGILQIQEIRNLMFYIPPKNPFFFGKLLCKSYSKWKMACQ